MRCYVLVKIGGESGRDRAVERSCAVLCAGEYRWGVAGRQRGEMQVMLCATVSGHLMKRA